MSMYRLSFSILLIVATALPACIIGERGSGVYAEQQRDVQTFSRVDLPGGGIDRVDIVVCDCTAMRISGDDNLLDLVTSDVSGETLTIDTVENVWTKEPLVVEVRTPTLDLVHASCSTNVSIIDLRGGDLTVETSGSGDVDFMGRLDRLRFETSGSSDIDVSRLETDALEIDTSGSTDVVVDEMISESIWIHTSGSSDIHLNGETKSLEIETSGSSDVLAQDMTAQDVTIRTSGSSDIETCVTGVLDVSTSGSGDVTYYCDPAKINANTSGSGNIRQGR